MTAPRALLGLALAGGLSCSSATPDFGFPAEPFATAVSASGGLHVALRSSPSQPPQPGLGSLEYTFTDASGNPVDGLTFTVLSWMPQMHHPGSSLTPVITPAGGGSGRYYLTNVAFEMPGEIQLRTSVSAPSTDSVVPVFVVE